MVARAGELAPAGARRWKLPDGASGHLEVGNRTPALVLCEVYGHTYNLAELERRAASTPAVRIVDMAMAVPCPALFQRLGSYDFGVISFGDGKSMYAGWGGIGFARERALAEAVRRLRDLALAQGDFPLLLRRALEDWSADRRPLSVGLWAKLAALVPGPSPARAGAAVVAPKPAPGAPATGAAGHRANPQPGPTTALAPPNGICLNALEPRPGLVEPPSGAFLSHCPPGPGAPLP